MQVEIDQSGKIENSNRLTVIAYANGNVKNLAISAKEKQKLLLIAREIDRPKKTYVFKIFAALVFLLVKDESIAWLRIDREYPGHEGTIKNVLLNLFERCGAKPPDINFILIGKSSNAHKAAIEVFRGKKKPSLIAKSQDIIELLYS